MDKNMIPGAPLEAEKEDELRIFSIFVNQRTGKYRLTSSDSVFATEPIRDKEFIDVLRHIKETYEKLSRKKMTL